MSFQPVSKGVFESAQEVVWSATRDAGGGVPWPMSWRETDGFYGKFMGKCGKIMGNGGEIWVKRRFLWEK